MATFSEIESKVGMKAEVSHPELVAVFDSNNNKLFVHPEVAQDLLNQGYRNAPLDVRATLSEFVAIAEAAIKAVEEFIEGVISDNEINTSDESAAVTAGFAMGKLMQVYNGLMADTYKTYPVVQGESIKLVGEDGKETQADPNQLDDFLKKGFKQI